MMPNVGRPRRRLSVGRILLAVLALVTLIALNNVDPALWTQAGWAVLALVATWIVRALAPQHAAWPLSLLALYAAGQSWQAPWAVAVAGAPLPWVILAGLAEVAFLATSATAASYAVQCSQTRQPASWAGYRTYTAIEIPRFTESVLHTMRGWYRDRVRRYPKRIK